MSAGRRWLLFDPYLASNGGGERYMFGFARALAAQGCDAVMAGPSPDAAMLERLGFPSTPVVAMNKAGFIASSRRFDASVVLTNHPPLPSLARRRYAVVQFPFTNLRATAIRGRVEAWSLARTRCVVYSDFARRWLVERWGVDGVVLRPAVELGSFQPDAKRNVILNVGRFFSRQHSKRQDVLVDAFAALPERIRAQWRLVLAGAVADDADARDYLALVQRKASGLAIDVVANADAPTLRRLYSEASLYWHATGFARRDDEPEKAEHFGMTTAEAMSYGAVPVVLDDGGQPEIVGRDCGVLWRSLDELKTETVALIDAPPRRLELAHAAVRAAARFGPAAFDAGVARLVGGGAP